MAAPAVLGLSVAFAQAKPHRIDVHHHIVPPTWLAAMDIIGRTDFLLENWSVQKTLEDMDKGGVATSMPRRRRRSVTGIGEVAAGRMARESNEYARMIEPIIPAGSARSRRCRCRTSTRALKEIADAFDTLKVDGVGCMTSYERQVARRSEVRAGVGRAQSPQGDGLHPSDPRERWSTWCTATRNHPQSAPRRPSPSRA